MSVFPKPVWGVWKTHRSVKWLDTLECVKISFLIVVIWQSGFAVSLEILYKQGLGGKGYVYAKN